MSKHEVDLLRAELLQNYSEITQYNCVLFAAAATILAFAIQLQSYVLCLIPYLIIVSIFEVCEFKRLSICRIGAYLYTFSEAKDYCWEKRLHTLDKLQGSVKEQRWHIHWHEHLQYYLICMCCSSAAIYNVVLDDFTKCGKAIRIVLLLLSTLIVLIILNRSVVRTPEIRERYIQEWKKILTLENQKK